MTNLPALPDMTRDHPKRFVAALNMLAAANHTTIDDANHEAYFEALGSLPIGAVETTCGTMARRNSAFMPTAGEVFTHADALAAQDWQATMNAQPALPAPDEWTEERARGSENRLTFLKALVPFLGIDRVKKLAPHFKLIPERYHCAVCRDMGWKPTLDAEGVERWGECLCNRHNPALERDRAHRRARRHARHTTA